MASNEHADGSGEPAGMLPRLRAAAAVDGFRAFVRLVFIALYSLAFIAAGFGQWSPTTSMLLYVLVSILWIGARL